MAGNVMKKLAASLALLPTIYALSPDPGQGKMYLGAWPDLSEDGDYGEVRLHCFAGVHVLMPIFGFGHRHARSYQFSFRIQLPYLPTCTVHSFARIQLHQRRRWPGFVL